MGANEQGPAAKASEAADERALIGRILAGEKQSFYQLVQPHERRVYLTAYAIVQNEADAEEVAQEAVLKAFRHLKEFRGQARFSTWLVRITINEARMRVRSDRKRLFQSIEAAQPDDERDDYHPLLLADWREVPSEAVERNEVREEIERALAQLPATYREVLVLRDIEQLSIAETSEALGISEELVKVRLFRARLRMRDILAPRLRSAAPAPPRRWWKRGIRPWS